MDDFGDHFFGEAFSIHFLSDFSEFGGPWGSGWESVGTNFWFNFFGGVGGRGGGPLVSESAESAVPQSRGYPCGVWRI